MTLPEKIRCLEQERGEALKSTGRIYKRFVGGVRRSLSPRRAIRKHPRVALGVSALAGMLIAPKKKEKKRRRRAQASATESPERNGFDLGGKAEKSAGVFNRLLGRVLAALLTRVDWMSLVNQFVNPPQPQGAEPSEGASAETPSAPGGEGIDPAMACEETVERESRT